jgi:hypothetical protein
MFRVRVFPNLPFNVKIQNATQQITTPNHGFDFFPIFPSISIQSPNAAREMRT